MIKQLTMEQYEGIEEDSIKIEDPNSNITKEVEVGSREHLTNLQLVMATTSVNHEYARTEYDEVKDLERRSELLAFMGECRDKYDKAREELSMLNPIILEEFEKDLAIQKSATLTHYHA